MLIDWTSGGARWMVTGVFSLIFHIVVLGLLVSTSESEEPRTEAPSAGAGQGGDALATGNAPEATPPASDDTRGRAGLAASDDSCGRGVPTASAKEDVVPSQAVGTDSSWAGRPRPAPEPPPRTPETIVRAESGSLDAIGKSFDESSTRLRNAGSSSERTPEAKPKKPEPRKTPPRKAEKQEKKRVDEKPVADAVVEDSEDTGYTWRVVKKGESLTRIAQEYGMTPLALAQLNGYKKPLSVRLRVGQKIKVKAK